MHTYRNTPNVITVKHTACIAPSIFSFSNTFLTSSNKNFPTKPPITAPTAGNVLVFTSNLMPSDRLRINDTTDIANTVQPEQKLIVETGKTPIISRTGLIITPPPARSYDCTHTRGY